MNINVRMLPKQTVPFPVWPGLQLQKKDPSVSRQVALTAQLCVCVVHSSMLEQLVPLPLKPVMQEHSNDPAVSWQVAFK